MVPERAHRRSSLRRRGKGIDNGALESREEGGGGRTRIIRSRKISLRRHGTDRWAVAILGCLLQYFALVDRIAGIAPPFLLIDDGDFRDGESHMEAFQFRFEKV